MTTMIATARAKAALSSGAPLMHRLAHVATLAQALAAVAERDGDCGATFVDDDGGSAGWTYRQLYRKALDGVAALRACGVAPGSRVVLRLADPRSFTLALWVCILGGYTAIPTSDSGALPTEPEALQQLLASLQLLEAGALIMADDQWRQASAYRPAPSALALLSVDTLLAAAPAPDSVPVPGAAQRIALIFPTSGSSGTPKPVLQTESAILAMCAGSAQMNAFTEADVFLNWMPMEHVGSVVFLGLLPALVGARQVHAAHAPVRRRMLAWLDLLAEYRASVAWVPNYVFSMVAKACVHSGAQPDRTWNLGALRFLVNAGESISPASMQQFAQHLQAYGLRADAIRPAFGMSETCSGITWSAATAVRRTHYVDLGAPIPGAAIRIVGADGQLLSEGEVGTLHVKGESVTRGYFGAGRDEKFLADGWFDTGDQGFIEEGRLFLTDREGDAIMIDGVPLHSYQIEAAIESLEGILGGHSAVCCVGEGAEPTLAAYYCPEPGQATQQARILQLLAAAAPAARVLAFPLAPAQLPRTSIGKIQRKILRRRLQASLAPCAPALS